MKIEKISENQIKCTLTHQDLSDRELQLSELAYGSGKAKALFSELMLQASYECGFDAEGAPLMIEAIPFDPDSLVLIVSKLPGPDEVDAQLSKMPFSPEDFMNSDKHIKMTPEAKNEILGRISDFIAKAGAMLTSDNEPQKEPAPKPVDSAPLQKVFSFETLSEVISLANVVAHFYSGKSSLYKDDWDDRYYLVFDGNPKKSSEFNKVCNIAAEYGTAEHTRYASVSYFEEHFGRIIKDSALKKLASLRNN